MSHSSDTHQSIAIVLAILRHIPKHYSIQAKDIQNKLSKEGIDLSLRSVQRYLSLLCEYYNIEKNDASKPYGYRWKAHSPHFDVPHLTEQQALLLGLTKKHLERLLPKNVTDLIAPLFDQANYQLQFDDKNKLAQQWLEKVSVVPTSQPLIPAQVDSEILDNISTALYQNKVLNIEYLNQEGKFHSAAIHPLGLAQQGGNLYLVAHYPKYSDSKPKNLAVHRFKKAEVSTLSFARPCDFDLDAYSKEGNFAWGQGKKIHLSFIINKAHGFHLTETPLSEDQKITDHPPHHYYVEATVYDSEMLDWWLMTFKDNVFDVKKEIVSY